MSERRRFLGGAAAGLFLAVAIVAAINLGISPVASSGGLSMMAKTVSFSSTSSSTPTSASVPSNYSDVGGAAMSTSTTTTIATSSRSSSSETAQSIQPSTAPGTTSGDNSAGGGLSAASLIQTVPAVAIALVLGVMVYQLSIRRVESG